MKFKILTEEEAGKFDRGNKLSSNQKNKIKIKRISQSWNKKEKKIIEEIRKKTNLKISTKGIVCNINPYISDGFYGYDNIMLGVANSNLESDIMVIAHELFHIFYWRKVRELGLSKGILGKEKIWEWDLAEVTVYLLQSELQKLWPNSKIELYPRTTNVYKKVKKLWKEEKFDNYLIKSYKLL